MESPENGGACFPPFPQTLEIEKADFHIPSAPGRDDEYNSSFKTRKDKNPASPTLRFLQAHPWIGKDYNLIQSRSCRLGIAWPGCPQFQQREDKHIKNSRNRYAE